VVSTTVHKTLGGARSGLILGKQEFAKAINSAVFPGQQGGPLLQAVAAKAVTFKIARTPEFAERQQRTLSGARIVAERLLAPDVAKAGVSVVSGGTDVHMVLVDLRNSSLDGKAAEDLLHDIGITVNRNAVPNDPRPPMVTSGLRVGTSALATRGFGDAEFTEVADIIGTALAAGKSADVAALRERVTRLTRDFPLYEGLEDWKLVDR
jgi:glycine hydroxymethyltransferase